MAPLALTFFEAVLVGTTLGVLAALFAGEWAVAGVLALFSVLLT